MTFKIEWNKVCYLRVLCFPVYRKGLIILIFA